MGSGKWDPANYTDAARTRAASGLPDFGHDADVRSGRATGIHADLDPKKVAGTSSPLAGKPVRESRDSDEHPNSLPIMVFFDVTGSMGEIPKALQKKLASLMDVVIAKAEIADPQVLVGAIGDSYSDQYPFQVGQFESDNRFDEQLRSIILEGNGGGQHRESYGLAYRFAAYHTATDSFEKRGKKGYLITMGDEAFWPTIKGTETAQIFGVQADDETVEDLFTKACERWEVFHLHIQEGSYRDRAEVLEPWQKLLGERLVKVEKHELVCETIAALLHSLETSHGLDKVLDDVGLTGAARTSVMNALVPVTSLRAPARIAKGKADGLVPAGTAGDSGVTRV